MKFKSLFQRRSSSSPTAKSTGSPSPPKKNEKGDGKLRSLMRRNPKPQPRTMEQVEETKEGAEGGSGSGRDLNLSLKEVEEADHCQDSGELVKAEAGETMMKSKLALDSEDDVKVQMHTMADPEVKVEVTSAELSPNQTLTESQIESSLPSEHELALMKIRDEKEKFEKKYEELLVKLKEVSAKLEDARQEFNSKQKEWDKAEADFMLCIRSAERFTREAETRAQALEADNARLREELNKIRDSTDSSTPLQRVETNCPLGHVHHHKRSAENDLPQAHKSESGESISKRKDGEEKGRGAGRTLLINRCSEQAQAYIYNRNRKLQKLRVTAGGSLRNALLGWCREQTKSYGDILEINNFSASWRDGKAISALLHSLEPTAFDYDNLKESSPLAHYEAAINSAKKLGVKVELDIVEVLSAEVPPWEKILHFVTELYCAVTPTP